MESLNKSSAVYNLMRHVHEKTDYAPRMASLRVGCTRRFSKMYYLIRRISLEQVRPVGDDSLSATKFLHLIKVT